MSGSAFAVTHHAFSSGAGRTSDGNGSHASTLKSPSYTKSVSWQHYRILLGLAVATEITGTLSMKWASVSEGNGGFILMLVMISLSYIFLSFAVKKIALGVAYALWEGIGILFITLFSVLLFDESLSLMKIAGLTTLVAGIVLIKSGTRKARKPELEVNHGAV